MKKRLNIKIYGRVQGVFFRHSAKLKAGDLKLFGLARNEPEGSLYIEVEGKEENLQKFLKWCRQGPPLAQVEKIEFELLNDLKNFQEFEL